MKLTSTIVLLSLLAAAPACSDSNAKMKDSTESVGDQLGDAANKIDLSKLSPEQLKEKVSDLADKIEAQADKIKDKASAVDVRDELDPLIDQMKEMKDKLGDKMPDMDSVSSAFDHLKEKLSSAGDDVKQAMQPLVDKLDKMLQ